MNRWGGSPSLVLELVMGVGRGVGSGERAEEWEELEEVWGAHLLTGLFER